MLLDRGLRTGDRVAYLGRNSDRLITLLLGCARSGVVLTPVNWRLAQEEVDSILDHAEAKLLVVSREHAGAATELPVISVDVWSKSAKLSDRCGLGRRRRG
jgi:acyl-CoA synthetase (AMP-forming)/AMP-acid ligase II